MTAYSQDDRPLRISSRLGDRVVAGELRALERTSVPFELEIRVFSEEPALPVESLVSDAVVIALENHPGQVRYFHGIVNGVSDAGEEGGLYAYDLHAVPWFWFLSLRSDCRIFAGKSVPEIVEEVLRTDSRIRFRSALTRSYEKREYSVQYRETDLAFVSRLLEDEGIAYHFEFTEQGHTLVLWDSPGAVEECLFRPDAAYDPAPSAADAGDCVRQLVYKTAARSRAVELADYDFERPRELLRAAVGAPGFTAGHRFELREHFRLGFNQKYRLLEVEHRASYGGFRSRTSDESYRYSNRFRATPAAMAYRPPCATPKPVVRGAQTAVVVGRPGEEIRPDRYGRIKVRFHWDRLARADESGSCSCWLRVSETWAGQNWGSLSLPRVGQEVIVDFLEGDPDRPIITGRVYNSSQMPGWPLPAAQTVSGVRTHSSLEGSGAN
ncbi:MAG: type VI secretion system tip protein TssI/VgrG, partial [Acidobacteria bacterium]|nr:type VI secretion system tip protein TssI/VgrG [Acidobacteriota bacterium]